MRIEDELKSRNFKSKKHRAQLNLLYTANWINGRINSILKPIGLTHEQFNILRILEDSHPDSLSMTEIRNRMIDPMSNVSRLIEKLYKRNFVCKEETNHDRRKVKVGLTEIGLRQLGEINLFFEIMSSTNSEFSDEDAVMLSNLIDKFRSSTPLEIPFKLKSA